MIKISFDKIAVVVRLFFDLEQKSFLCDVVCSESVVGLIELISLRVSSEVEAVSPKCSTLDS